MWGAGLCVWGGGVWGWGSLTPSGGACADGVGGVEGTDGVGMGCSLSGAAGTWRAVSGQHGLPVEEGGGFSPFTARKVRRVSPVGEE